ncbi:MAG: SET domain-containing protein-lysine N-methyltransferase [Alphaproteobacteria bacterium]|nr:SET domain-containing protein-lysine N-methyltransferase [Alphaproteobacteria bacterium]
MIEVRSSAIHGRGVFSTEFIRRGELFHTAHLLVFDCDQSTALSGTLASNYVFHIEDCADDPACQKTGLAMSPISFINHHRRCNATFVVNGPARTIDFTAVRDIAPGEEITIDYGDFAEKLGIAD